MPYQADSEEQLTELNQVYLPNKLVRVANYMAPGVGSVIDHLEYTEELVDQQNNGNHYDHPDTGIIIRLITEAARHRARELAQAYRVIGQITSEINQDFPHRVTLLRGQVNPLRKDQLEAMASETLYLLRQRLSTVPKPELIKLQKDSHDLYDLNESPASFLEYIMREIIYRS